MKKHQFLVRVSCMTYNQAPYILDALNGFTMQQTNFPFVCVIMDDASTDGEPKVIQQYLQDNFDLEDKLIVHNEETDDYELRFARHKLNLNCYFAVFNLKYNHYSIKKSKAPYIQEWINSKYIAICEGDDYWITTDKLQKQVDYLEFHPDHGMVYTACQKIIQQTSELIPFYTKSNIHHDDNFKWEILKQTVQIGTCTTLIRTNLYIEVRSIKDDFQGFIMGDTQTWFNAARLAKVGYVSEITGVYRKHQSGVTATFDPNRRAGFIRGCLDLDLHLAYKYGAPKGTVKVIKKRFGIDLMNLYLKSGDYNLAIQTNQKLFHNSLLYALTIKMSKLFGAKSYSILSRVNYHLANIGLINL